MNLVEIPSKGDGLRAEWGESVARSINAFGPAASPGSLPFTTHDGHVGFSPLPANKRERRVRTADTGCFRIVGIDGLDVTFANCYLTVGGIVKEVSPSNVVKFSDILSPDDPPDGSDYHANDKPYVFLKVVMRPTAASGAGSFGFASVEAAKKWDGNDASVPGVAQSDMSVVELSKDTSLYVRPLYKLTHSGAVAVDFRNMPLLGAMEFGQ